jgi:drug/metabolite transporter (DMT)-like permease
MSTAGQTRTGLISLSALAMIAFAANSILNRLALTGGDIDPAGFAMVRVVSASIVLTLVVLFKSKSLFQSPPNWFGAVALFAYMVGFSFAYVVLDAGFGALLLFGGVQITMFLGAIFAGQKPRILEWVGAVIAFGGLIYLFDPQAKSEFWMAAIAMVFAAIGWGVFSLVGRKAIDPAAATAKSFLVCVIPTILLWFSVSEASIAGYGFMLACISGGLTSALGYLLWYRILPQLAVTSAAVMQLSVPLLASMGGLIFLNEPLSSRFIVATLLVLGGIGLSVWAKK